MPPCGATSRVGRPRPACCHYGALGPSNHAGGLHRESSWRLGESPEGLRASSPAAQIGGRASLPPSGDSRALSHGRLQRRDRTLELRKQLDSHAHAALRATPDIVPAPEPDAEVKKQPSAENLHRGAHLLVSRSGETVGLELRPCERCAPWGSFPCLASPVAFEGGSRRG